MREISKQDLTNEVYYNKKTGRRKKAFFTVLGFAFLIAAAAYYLKMPENVLKEGAGRIKIVIDPGHGGFDGGYDPSGNGISSPKEKEINLSIALKLKKKLEDEGFEVIMTREDDKALCEDSDSNKKRTDMRNRVELINGSGANLVVSIHQNSFPQKSSKGAQVFYYKTSEEGKRMAEIMQNCLREDLWPENNRQPKADSSYYMLKKSVCPIIIVECGFLSNPEEAALLNDEKYQDKTASSICRGIKEYIDSSEGTAANDVPTKGSL